eukprot:scaffold285_cov330-Pavlova_lutheri.AAC.68
MKGLCLTRGRNKRRCIDSKRFNPALINIVTNTEGSIVNLHTHPAYSFSRLSRMFWGCPAAPLLRPGSTDPLGSDQGTNTAARTQLS